MNEINSHSINICIDFENHYILNDECNQLQPQAVYAKVQRRPRSPLYGGIGILGGAVADIISNSSKDDGTQYRSFHVTLFKDKVYDDYGFSVSDGLYERGVYINRIRSGGPADVVGLLKPFDRIMQVLYLRKPFIHCYCNGTNVHLNQILSFNFLCR